MRIVEPKRGRGDQLARPGACASRVQARASQSKPEQASASKPERKLASQKRSTKSDFDGLDGDLLYLFGATGAL